MSILQHFPPGFTPRPLQVDILERVMSAFETGVRFVVIEAPPGVGKTLVATTLARQFGDAWICTVTKQLQNQIIQEFEEIGARELRGRGSYVCKRLIDATYGTPEMGDAHSCEAGAERFRKDPCRAGECPYRLAKAEALKSPMAICNYMSFLYNVGVGKFSIAAGLTPLPDEEEEAAQWVRPLLVCDEAHRLESVLLDHTAVTINAGRLPIKLDLPFPATGNAPACFAWLELFLEDATAEMERDELDEHLTAKARKELRGLMSRAQFAVDHRDAEEWIAEPTEDGKPGFVLKPLTVKSFAERVFKYGDKVVLMSATILDAQKVTAALGINPIDYVFVRTDCPFPVENRQVICSGLNMNKVHRDRSWPQMTHQVGLILEHHEKDKGLVLTSSNEMADYLMAQLPPRAKNRLLVARGADRMEKYQRHVDARYPSVLIAPGFWEGADLKNDLSRFQILPAIPRAQWAGQVAARAGIDPDWYRLIAFQQLIQGLGRSVRNDKDYATSYVFDADLKREAQRADSLLPQWFRDALVFA